MIGSGENSNSGQKLVNNGLEEKKKSSMSEESVRFIIKQLTFRVAMAQNM